MHVSSSNVPNIANIETFFGLHLLMKKTKKNPHPLVLHHLRFNGCHHHPPLLVTSTHEKKLKKTLPAPNTNALDRIDLKISHVCTWTCHSPNFGITFPLTSHSYHPGMIGTTKAPKESMAHSRQTFQRSTAGPAPYMNVKSNNDSAVDSSLNESNISERNCPVAKKQGRKKHFNGLMIFLIWRKEKRMVTLISVMVKHSEDALKMGNCKSGISHYAIQLNVHRFLITKERDSWICIFWKVIPTKVK